MKVKLENIVVWSFVSIAFLSCLILLAIQIKILFFIKC